MWGENMFIQINRNDKTSIIKQIYNQIRYKILNGDLKSGERLPSSRKLADIINVSRNVIVEVYEILTIEGYTTSSEGSGTFVNKNVSILRSKIDEVKVNLEGMKEISKGISFRSGLPALDKFPRNKWLQCYREAIMEMDDKELGYDFPNGYEPLRKTLVEYLLSKRGIRCHPNQIIITNGAVQGLFLMSQFFKDNSASILIEEPTTKGIRDIFEASTSSVISTPIDSEGLNPDNFPHSKNISCIVATPSHQYPLGSSLSVARRIKLINYAREKNCYIIEDDYDSEYRYDKAPVGSLHELDSKRVIYLGSFSKILLPSIRIGYIILPTNLIESVSKIKSLIDIHCPTINQGAMEKFISRGYLSQHLSKSKKLYKKRRSTLIHTLEEKFGEKVKILGNQTGIHLVADFEGIEFSDDLMESIEREGVYISRVSDHAYYPKNHLSQLIFGYGNVDEENIKIGIAILHHVLSSGNVKDKF